MRLAVERLRGDLLADLDAALPDGGGSALISSLENLTGLLEG